MKTAQQFLFSIALLVPLVFVAACSGDDDDPGAQQSLRNDITDVVLDLGCAGGTPTPAIDLDDAIVELTVPFGTDVTSLAPVITVSEDATLSPDPSAGLNFTTPQIFTVTAENGDEAQWIVRVLVNTDPSSQPTLQVSAPVYNLNVTTGNLPTWLGVDNQEDAIAYYDGKIYVTVNHDQVQIVNPETGAATGTSLSTDVNGGPETIGGGSITLSGIDVDAAGQILASNVIDAGSGGGIFKIYKWADDTSDPEVFISYQTPDNVRLGDNLQVVGDLTGNALITATSGRVFASGQPDDRIFVWEVSGGALTSATPTITEASGYSSPQNRFGSRADALIPAFDATTYYANGNDMLPAQFNLADGTLVEQMANPEGGGFLLDGANNAFEVFELCGETYMAIAWGGTQSVGGAYVVNITNGLAAVTPADVTAVGVGPGAFVPSGQQNIDASASVAVNVTAENAAELYILNTNQVFARVNLTFGVN